MKAITRNLKLPRELPWAGILGGPFFWYFAHELGFYMSDLNCKYRWPIRLVHAVALAGVLYCGLLSYRAWKKSTQEPNDEKKSFLSLIGTMAAALFAFVVLWQGVASFIFSGCER